MFYICFGTFLRGIVTNVLFLFPVCILFAILLGLCIPFGVLSATICMAVLSLIVIVFLIVMMFAGNDWGELMFGIGALYVSKYDIEKFKKGEKGVIYSNNKKIVGRLVKGKPICAAVPFVFLFVHLIIAVGCGVVLSFIFNGTLNIGEVENVIISAVTTGTALWQLTYFIVKLIYYIKSTCFKCGKIFCKVEVSRDELDFRAGTHEVTKKTQNKVGEIYAGGKSIGGIYQDSYDTYEVYSSYSKYKINCKCAYCQKASSVIEESSDYSKKLK